MPSVQEGGLCCVLITEICQASILSTLYEQNEGQRMRKKDMIEGLDTQYTSIGSIVFMGDCFLYFLPVLYMRLFK